MTTEEIEQARARRLARASAQGAGLTLEEDRAIEREAIQAETRGPRFELVDVDKIFAPLPPVPYLVQRLDMCPGAPTLFAGYGFSGKTLAAQALALSVCTGRDVWSDFMVQRSGRVVHLDFEQGFRLTAERYQRLARARGFEREKLSGLLHLAALPSLTLSHRDAREALLRACDGRALVIVDSLRACAPDVDENSSDARRVLDLLTSVSDKTGCVPLVIHHARKPREDGEGGAKVAIRGSSAIFDACSSVCVFSAKKGEPTIVQHEKARTSGTTEPDFALEVHDVEIAGNARGGLDVRAVAVESSEEKRGEAEQRRHREIDELVFDFIAKNPGANTRTVRALEGVRATEKDDALARLELAGRVVVRPAGKARTYWAQGGKA